MDEHQSWPVRRALARAGLYRLCALGFAYPEPGVRAEFQRVLELQRTAEPRVHDLPDLDLLHLDRDPGAVSAVEALAAEYLRLFDRTVACSPYEAENAGGMRAFTRSRDLADVLGYYQAFGLEIGPEAHELADHIRIELEFISNLALKEAYFLDLGDEDALGITCDAERGFLREHLGRWVGVFCGRLEASAELPFYRTLSRLTEAFVAAEMDALGVQPLPLHAGPADAGGEEEVLTCPRAATPKVELPLAGPGGGAG